MNSSIHRIFSFLILIFLIFPTCLSATSVVTSTATISGIWNSTTTWRDGIIPTVADDVTITQGFTIYIDTFLPCNALSLTLEKFAKIEYLSTGVTASTLTVSGDITFGEGAEIKMIANNPNDCFVLNTQDLLLSNPGTKLNLTANASNSRFTLNVNDIDIGTNANFSIRVTSGPSIVNLNIDDISIANAGITELKNDIYSSTITLNLAGSLESNGTLRIWGTDPGGTSKPDSPAVRRNCRVVGTTVYSSIISGSGSSISLLHSEFSGLGQGGISVTDLDGASATGGFEVFNCNIYNGYVGVHFKNSTRLNKWYSIAISSSIIHNNTFAGIIFENTTKSGIYNCIISTNGYGIYFLNSSMNSVNNSTIYGNRIRGIYLRNADKNLIKDNIVRDQNSTSGEEGIYLYGSQKNVIVFNQCFNNPVHGIALEYGSNYNYLAKNYCYNNGNGGLRVRYGSDNNVFVSNISSANLRTGFTSHSSIKNLNAEETYSNNAWGDIYVEGEANQGYRSQIWLKNCLLQSPTEFANTPEKEEFTHPESWVISQRHNQQNGLTRIWGNFTMPQTWLHSELKWNFSEPLYEEMSISWLGGGVPDLRYDDSGEKAISSITTSSTTKTELWLVSYDANRNRWLVQGTVCGVQSKWLDPDTDYQTDGGEVRFRLTHQAGGPSRGEEYVFITLANSKDENVQKRIEFSDFSEPKYIGASFTNQSGGSFEAVGTLSSPTIVTNRLTIPNTSFYYGFALGGTINKIEYTNFTFFNSNGLTFNSAPLNNTKNIKITNLQPGTTIASYLTAKNVIHTFDEIVIDTTNVSGTFNVKANNSILYFRDYTRSFLPDKVTNSQVHWDPTLAWSEQTGFTSDGVEPNHAERLTNREFQIKYYDRGLATNGNPPTNIQVWVDLNDNQIYEPNEKFNLAKKTGVGNNDNYTDSEIYSVVIPTVNYAGDGTLNYRFYATNDYSLTVATYTVYTASVTNTGLTTREAHGAPMVGKTIVNGTLSVKGTPPMATVETPITEQLGDIVLTYHLIDTDGKSPPGNYCSVEVKYTKDGQTWYTATRSSASEKISELEPALSPGATHTFTWSSISDIPEQEVYVKIRITPTDEDGVGSPGESQSFKVDNIKAAKLIFTTSVQELLVGATSQVVQIVAQSANSLKDDDANFVLNIISNSTNYAIISSTADVILSIGSTTISMTNGEAKFRYRDENIGTPNITVSEKPDQGIADCSQQWWITRSISAIQSSITVTQIPYEVGKDTVSITITLRDINGIPATGKTNVQITVSGSSNVVTQPTLATDQNGQTVAKLWSTKAEQKIISAITENIVLLSSAAVTFVPTTVDANISTFTVSAVKNIPVGNTVTITVTLKDKYFNPVSSKTVTIGISPLRSNDILTQPSALTNANGQTAATFCGNTAESKVVTVTDYTDNIPLSLSYTINFVAITSAQQDFGTVFKESIYAYPNPVRNGQVKFNYSLVSNTKVTLKVYTLLGEIVWEEEKTDTAGTNKTFPWNCINESNNSLGTGIYIYKMIADDGTKKYEVVKKLMIIQ